MGPAARGTGNPVRVPAGKRHPERCALGRAHGRIGSRPSRRGKAVAVFQRASQHARGIRGSEAHGRARAPGRDRPDPGPPAERPWKRELRTRGAVPLCPETRGVRLFRGPLPRQSWDVTRSA